MTSTPDLQLLDGCDDPASVLGYARERKAAEDRAGRELMRAAARWVSMHSADSLVGPVDAWHERSLPLGGEGCPEVAEFAVAEFAAAVGKSTESGRRYLARAAEGFYRLTRCWARLEAGDLPAWKLGMIADATMALSPAAAAFVDQHVTPVAHKVGPPQLMRLVEEGKALFDPEQIEADRLAAAETRHVDIDLDRVGVDGIVRVDSGLDLADALDLETAVADLAHQLLVAGDDSPLDVRRSKALGLLARGQHTLEPAPDQPAAPQRQVVLHVHLSQDAVLGTGGLARLGEVAGPVTVEQIRQWCGTADVVVKPVIDLNQRIQVGSYEIPDRLRDQVKLRDGTCVFPQCTRDAEHCDIDHIQPYDRGGTTSSDNLAVLCRRHHRHKSIGGWTYWMIEPGLYLWRSPLGHYYVRDHTGTV